MAGPLLATKFHVPRARRGMVARPRLIDRLNRAAESAITIVSAPAGFGKTTLLTQWLATASADGRSTAWLSVDRRDNDPATFWTYVITALHSAANGVGAEALSLLQTTAPMEAVLSGLLNDLNSLPGDVMLVLDDYHLIDAHDVHDGIAFLVDHLPPQLRLLIAGRADPALPLARLRARGELVEIRAADLRFTPGEAAAYLNDAMGLALTPADVAALDGRTEGWIAALQLAALSMQGRDDVAGFIAGFAGDDRYIVDYLAEEVLNRQPADVRKFLLETSILDRLSGPLCDAVTGRDGGRAMLGTLERGNLFLIPLDDRRRWYRYHQLFSDVLQAHLREEQPGEVPDLHLRASGWFERTGELSEAIRHALAAMDFERTADLVERAIPAISRNRQEASALDWLTLLPDEVIRVRPVLIVGLAGALLSSGEIEGVEARLQDAERWLDLSRAVGPGTGAVPAGMVVVDDEQFRLLPGMIELYRAALALAVGEVAETVRHARRAVELSGGDHLRRAAAAGLLGLAAWTSGDLEAAHSAYSECSAGLLRAGYVADTLGCAIALADIRRTQGRLGDAERTFDQALRRAGADGQVLRGTADMYVGLSEIHRERGDLAAATRYLLKSQELGEYNGLPQNRYRWRVAMARIREATGDLDGARQLLDEAERFYIGDFFPLVRPVPAIRARLFLAQGRWEDALGWVAGQGLSAQDDLSYLREFEHITLARVLLAGHLIEPGAEERADDDVTRLLERLRQAAEEGERAGSVIEILVLQALSHQARGDMTAALAGLQRALILSEPEGYLRIFVDEGPPMAALLRAAAKKGIATSHVRRLLAAFENTTDLTVDNNAGPLLEQGLVEPLSERELEVLRLLGTDLDGPEIARALIVSLNTVRTHTKHIYAKLGVTNRRAAVRRAQELDLITGTRGR